MSDIARKALRGTILRVLVIAVVVAVPAVAIEYIDKEHRDSFLSPDLRKKFYTIEGQTCRFLDRQHSNVTGLIESFRGTSRYAYDIFTRSFAYGTGGALDCQSFTYDGAVAALAYMLSGRTAHAARILKVYRHDFYREKNDSIGLFNSYRTDRKDRIGICGGVDGGRIHVGPNMWVGVAALQYTALTGDLQFLSFAVDIARWAKGLNHYEFEDGGRGAVSMGFGWGPDWSNVYSTENNADYYAVLSMLKRIYELKNPRIENIFKGRGYTYDDVVAEMQAVARWMKDVAYDEKEKTFHCGYNEKGTDRTRALDTVTWSIAAFGPSALEEMGIDPFRLVEYAERKFTAFNVVRGERIKGFDFTDAAGRLRKVRLVWVEGTAQQIVAYQLMSRYAREREMEEREREYRQKAQWYSDELQRAATLVGFIDNALPYTCKNPAEKEIIFTFENNWEVPRGHSGQWVGSVSSTVWRYFALAGFNPLSLDTETVNYRLFDAGNQ